MAGEEGAAEEAEATSAGGGKKKKLIIIVAGVLVLAGIGGGAAFFFMGSEAPKESAEEKTEKTESGESKEKEDSTTEPGAEKKPADAKDTAGAQKDASTAAKESRFNFGQTYPLKPFHLNLGNPLENRYLRLEIALEFRQGDSQRAEIEARLPQLRDAVIAVASRKTREFLLGPDGKDQLRLEILTRVNQYMDMKVDSVFITDLLIE